MNSHYIKAIQSGLPLVSQPWQSLAEKNGLVAKDLIEQTKLALKNHSIKRFGLVVKHRTLGYTANAMVVWDVPDEQIEDLGQKMAQYPFVRLCYQRPRRLPHWPYNLFCMIHAQSKQEALIHLDKLIESEGLKSMKYDVLFSKRCFKQRGAVYR